jgi:hypothetical protein
MPVMWKVKVTLFGERPQIGSSSFVLNLGILKRRRSRAKMRSGNSFDTSWEGGLSI